MQKRVIEIENIEGAIFFKWFEDLSRKIDEIKSIPANQEREIFMTRQDVADLYKITIPTTYAWEKVGIFKPYKIANKTRFRRTEVLAAAKDISIKGGQHV